MLVSYCTTCHKRLWQLVQTLDHNLKYTQENISELCIVFYNDLESYEYLLKHYFSFIVSKQLRIIYHEEDKVFEDGSTWSCGYVKDIIHKAAKGEVLFNLDADNFIDDALHKRLLILKENELLITKRKEWLPDGRSGRIGVHSKLYKNINYRDKGRNDDGDFINRCVRTNCKVIEISCFYPPISNNK